MENPMMSRVSKSLGVTPRMLRYYEKMGLIDPPRREGSDYRTYDENAVRRLRQIVLLRKLRIPLKEIAAILDGGRNSSALAILRRNLSQLDGEIAALGVIREILDGLTERLGESARADPAGSFDPLSDRELTALSDTLCLSKKFVKGKSTMELSIDRLNRANEMLGKRQSDVRIMVFPPYTVAAHHFIGPNPEETVGNVISEFVQKSRLCEKKPDARMFGFNHPQPGVLKDGLHGYEYWVTVPEDMELPEPLVKKRFSGGLYAVMTISIPEFHRWDDLYQWVRENEQVEPDFDERGAEIMGGCFEEHLNWLYNASRGWPEDELEIKLDLMLPVKKRERSEAK